MINLLVFLTDGFELGIGFCMSLFKCCILLVQKFLIVLAVGAYLQEFPSHGVILLQFLFMLSLVLCFCLIELDFLQAVHNRFQISQNRKVFGNLADFFHAGDFLIHGDFQFIYGAFER